MEALSQFIHNPAYFQPLLFVVSIFAGVFGAILGLGGGIIIIPTLTLVFGVDIRHAIGTSIVAIIATSSSAAATYVKEHISNIRVAMLLEMATACGAFCGVLLAPHVPTRFLYLLFTLVLLYSSTSMWRSRKQDLGATTKADPLATKLGLNSSYYDRSLKRVVDYTVGHVKLAFSFMIGAGTISGLLGVGSGFLKVPAMDRAMGLPIKVSTATSNFMIGVTAAASAGTYFMRGDVIPSLAAPTALGVFVGSWLGAKLLQRASSKWIRILFIVVLLIIACQMALKAAA